MLASAQKAFDEADKNGSGTRVGASAAANLSFRANLQGAWDDRKCPSGSGSGNASRIWKAGELGGKDRAERESSQLKYREAQKAYERLLTPLEKYTRPAGRAE